jgi:CelD/BcsL family acetyltransferase involved in cellulose biosynthesis
LRPDAPLLGTMPRRWPRQSPEFQSLLPMEPCPYLALPAEWETLTARLGKKMRSNLGYYDRLLFRTFPDAELTLADEANLDAGMTALFALHQSRWNARWLPGVLGNKRVQSFHREVAARFLENGWLRLHLLRAEGELRAALYCFSLSDRTFYYLGGFAPEYSKYSLGTLLTAQAIRQAISENHSEFDFLRGNESYKYRWLPEERINQRILLLRPRRGLGELPGRAGFALNRVERYVEHRVKAFAEQQGRKTKGVSEA